MASDLLTGLLEGSIRQMMAGGFTRRRALAAISRVVEATIEEHEKSGRNSRPGPLLQQPEIAAEWYLPALRSADSAVAERYRVLASHALSALDRDGEARKLCQ